MTESGQKDGRTKVEYETMLGKVNSIILRYGVVISAALISVGIIIALLNSGKEGIPSSLSQLTTSSVGNPVLSLATLLSGVIALNGVYIIQLGVLILLATPLVRVAVTTILFGAEKDKTYVLIGIVVLLVLLFSTFVVGPFEANRS
ncbi:MAG TPA: DUF1634 domain-containing protein [Nitrososphaerales archaeon]|nr:DUF1634 domain-containing protein [Nitrososphaerales archaeon]